MVPDNKHTNLGYGGGYGSRCKRSSGGSRVLNAHDGLGRLEHSDVAAVFPIRTPPAAILRLHTKTHALHARAHAHTHLSTRVRLTRLYGIMIFCRMHVLCYPTQPCSGGTGEVYSKDHMAACGADVVPMRQAADSHTSAER